MRWMILCLALLTAATAAPADNVKPDDLEKMYNDTLVQLKAAQNRKAELATQNEKLAARIAEMEKQIQAQSAQLDELKRQASSFADRTFFLRSHYAAWEQFIAANPALKAQWEIFMRTVAWVSAPQAAIFMDPQWPVSMER
ncbi:MAG: hypothetical protein ABSB74_03350 [Tepidisphaeraceae bacterium]